jgi:hypothetical protein
MAISHFNSMAQQLFGTHNYIKPIPTEEVQLQNPHDSIHHNEAAVDNVLQSILDYDLN